MLAHFFLVILPTIMAQITLNMNNDISSNCSLYFNGNNININYNNIHFLHIDSLDKIDDELTRLNYFISELDLLISQST